MSFGSFLTDARKKVGLSQKDLAALVKKEDGASISPQYLNDIEHDRRNPPGDCILRQLASTLNISLDYLGYLAGRAVQVNWMSWQSAHQSIPRWSVNANGKLILWG